MAETDNNPLIEQLAEIEKAIHTILVGGQSYRIGNRSLTRANLAELFWEKARLESELAAQNNGGIFTEAIFYNR